MACPDFSALTAVIDCCILTIKDTDGNIKYWLNLNTLSIITLPNGLIRLSDAQGNGFSASEDDLAAMGLSVTALELAAKDCACDQNTTDLEVVCALENDNLYLLDLTELPPVVYDFAGNDVTGTITPTYCRDVTFDTEKEFYCVDGVDYTRNDCIKKDKNGIVLSVDSFWTDNTGAIVTDPSIGATVITKGVCVICDAAQESFNGNNATLPAFNEYEIFVPKCCEVTITTSAGTITLPPQSSAYMYCKKFDCAISGFDIAADCVDDITTILTKTI